MSYRGLNEIEDLINEYKINHAAFFILSIDFNIFLHYDCRCNVQLINLNLFN